MSGTMRVSREVRDALSAGRPVVALETSVVAHGLPAPLGMEAHLRCVSAVRRAGAVPAAVAVLRGEIVVGADESEVARLGGAGSARPAKAGARDLAPLATSGGDAGTTVSATVAIAARAGIRVMATGGIGGVHRALPGSGQGTHDVSADLAEIARSPVCLVSAGPKAILDLAATAEALETLGVPTVGYGTGEMPAFYCDASGVALEHRVEDAAAAARVLRVHWEVLGRGQGVLVLVPPPEALPRAAVEAAIATALAEAGRGGVGGKAVTPFLLDAVARAAGRDVRGANVALLERNAAVAAEIAAALGSVR